MKGFDSLVLKVIIEVVQVPHLIPKTEIVTNLPFEGSQNVWLSHFL